MGGNGKELPMGSQNLVRLRHEHELSQFDVCLRTHINTSQLSKMENGETIQAKYALRLARFFGVSVEQFNDEHLATVPIAQNPKPGSPT